MTVNKPPSFFKRLSLRTQLTIIIFAAILSTYIIESVFFTFQDFKSLEQAAKDNVESIARSMSQNFVKMILLDSSDASADAVAALKGFPSVLDTYLYDKEQTPIFQYHHPESLLTEIPRPKLNKEIIVSDHAMHLYLPVNYQNSQYGYAYFRVSKQLLEQWKSRQLKAKVILVILILAFAIIIAYYFQNYFSAPVLQLTETMSQIADQKDYSIRVQSSEQNEIGVLYTGFNQMLSEIQKINRDLMLQKYAIDQSAIVSTTDANGDITYCNDKFIEISGYSEKELMGRNHRILNSGEHDKAFFQGLWQTISSGQVWHGTIKNRSKGGHFYWVDSTIVPIVDNNNQVTDYLSIRFEITRQKNYEQELFQLNHNLEQLVEERTQKLQQSNERLIKSEKMASLGELVAGVAHEINTPIGNGMTGATYLQEELKQLKHNAFSGQFTQKNMMDFIENCDEACSIITQNLGRAADLIQSFKRVSVEQSSEHIHDFNLCEYINDTLLSLRPALKKTQLEVVINCDNSLQVISYPGAISQILTNFVNNSLSYAYEQGDQGKLEITVTSDGDQVILLYADDGKGMTEKVCQRIFDPFFTTGRGQGGTGLGLHVVYNIVSQQLQGEIHCNSQEGKGTQFSITFPRELSVKTKDI